MELSPSINHPHTILSRSLLPYSVGFVLSRNSVLPWGIKVRCHQDAVLPQPKYPMPLYPRDQLMIHHLMMSRPLRLRRITKYTHRRPQGEHIYLWRLHTSANEHIWTLPPMYAIKSKASLFQNSSGPKIRSTSHSM